MIPTPVTIIRPKRSLAEHLGMVIGQILGLGLAGFLIMLVLPHTILSIAPGFWETALTVAAIRLARGSTSQFLIWSREAK